ncbi:hypothetical protein GCM10022204_43980 [Microlunatus aurantiacus]|uniref:Mutator family transposase n=1 Tax=Microlunatus aurantiacus TaxID=446786 RepID=A0ABP7EIK6_9ACTN
MLSRESNAGWLTFFRGLTARGLSGVSLVTSDAHAGLVATVGATLPGAGWQRCRTHYAANLMQVTPKSSWGWVKALLHSVYDQPDAEAVQAQFDRIADDLADKLPQVAAHLEEARAEVLAFTAYLRDLWRQIWSNNPNERLNRGIRRRRDLPAWFSELGRKPVRADCDAGRRAGGDPESFCQTLWPQPCWGQSPRLFSTGGRVTSERRVARTAGLSAITDFIGARGMTVMDVVTTIGVDAHSQVHVAAAVDPQGRVIAERTITASTQQLGEFVEWVGIAPF